MKKENKKMAQERRAVERKKEAQKGILKKIGMICIPILILVVLFFIGTHDFSGDKNTSAEGTTTAGESTTASTPALLTDTALTVENGDTINLDYVGSIDGVEFDGGNTNGMGTDLVIGSGSYIDDFEEQLIGAHPGDNVDVTVTFPEDYGNESLAGKEALFKCTVNGIYE